jgi:hypothetical protein
VQKSHTVAHVTALDEDRNHILCEITAQVKTGMKEYNSEASCHVVGFVL